MLDISTLVQQYGYIGIFLLLILGIVGLPIPDEVLLTYVGYNVYLGRLSLVTSIIVAICGTCIGITVSYQLGKMLGLPFLERFGPKVKIGKKKLDATGNLFSKYGGILLFIGYFIPGIRHITAYIAGIASYRKTYFSLFAYSGAIVWVSVFIGLGNLLGGNWMMVEQFLLQFSKALWFILLLIVLTFIYKWLSHKQSSK
ncbi:DedA family protein [Neobacillus niacini]|uniref:DedA family protein n=1 Tax=Neobacillus niacini TaxID=86668 RepID=UPI0021CAF8AA|nr:DedA family protein [Neobacillus niacini]MCM3766382.1 DedA family protein [Neobacillus niacini]